MAITGTFAADFSSFQSAVDGAQIKLRAFEDDSNKVATSLTRMSDSLSGIKIVQQAKLSAEAVERIGGVSKLTSTELARVGASAQEAVNKLRALGQDIPAGIQHLADMARGAAEETLRLGSTAKSTTSSLDTMKSAALGIAGAFGIGLSVGAVVNFGREVLAAGDQIQKMADQTGLSIAEVQKLQYIAGQSGTSIQSLVGAVQNLQQRLGDDDTGAAGAMAKLGIHADAFNKLNTYQQMTTLADAVRAIQDPTEQAATAAAVFGKTWKEILPAIKGGMTETGDAATIMADKTVQSLDRVGDALERGHQGIVSYAGTGAANFIESMERMQVAAGNFFSSFDPRHWGVSNDAILQMLGNINDPDGLKGAFASIPPVVQSVSAAYQAHALTATELARTERDLAAEYTASVAANKAAADAEAKWADVMGELNATGIGWKGTLNTLSGSVAEAIKFYLAAGVSQASLATAYGLTAGQVKAVDSALKDELATQAKTLQAAAEWAAVTERVRVGTQSLQERIDSIDGSVVEWSVDLLQSGVDARTVATYYGLTDDQIKALEESMRTTGATAAAMSQTIVKSAEDASRAVRTLAGEYLSLAEAQKRHDAGNATSFDLDTPEGRAAVPEDLARWLHEGYSLQQAAIAAAAWAAGGAALAALSSDPAMTPIGPRVPGFAEGGTVAVRVGERGPETVRLPLGSTVFPSGTGAGDGGSIVNHFYVNGTAEDVARQVSDRLMKQWKLGRRFGSA